MEQIPELKLPAPMIVQKGKLLTWLAQQPLEYSDDSDDDDYPSD